MSEDTQSASTVDYDAFVATVVENNIERDGSPWMYVANTVVITLHKTNAETPNALLYSATPYCTERIWPRDVIAGSEFADRYPFSDTYGSSIRTVAVNILGEDLHEYAVQNTQSTIPLGDYNE